MDHESGKGSNRIIFVSKVFVFNQNSRRQRAWRRVCLGLILFPPKAGNGLSVHEVHGFYNAQKTSCFEITIIEKIIEITINEKSSANPCV